MGARRGADAIGMRFVAPRQAAATLLCACLALAGCGTSTGSTRLTSAQLASEGSAICTRAAREEKALSAQSLAAAIPRIEEIGRREVTELSTLDPPTGEQGSYRLLLSDMAQILRLLKAMQSSLSGGGSPSPALLAQGRQIASQLAQADGRLGMSACSSASS